MKVDLLSLFPGYFRGPLDESMLRRARQAGHLEINLVDIRDFAEGRHRQVDDRPYGGGPGMVLMPEPTARALDSVRTPSSRTIYMSPQGRPLTPSLARELSKEEHLVILCGHYEGVDQRVIETRIDDEVSIGDYVLTNGCLASIVLLDATARFIPGVLGKEESANEDSFEQGRLKGPQYTRPQTFEGIEVPEVLLSGHHAEIMKWRSERFVNVGEA